MAKEKRRASIVVVTPSSIRHIWGPGEEANLFDLFLEHERRAIGGVWFIVGSTAHIWALVSILIAIVVYIHDHDHDLEYEHEQRCTYIHYTPINA